MTELGLASPTSTAGRRSLAKQGKAMPGGRYPVPNVAFLKKAMRAIGRTPPAKRPAVRAYIRQRARALGATSMLKSPAWSMSNAELIVLPAIELSRMLDVDLALAGTTPVVGASDGPRVLKSSGIKMGLQPHQVMAYAKLRRRGVKHKTAINLAKRVESRANDMGSATRIGSGTGSQAYARSAQSGPISVAGTASTTTSQQLGSAAKAGKGRTNQKAIIGPQSSGTTRSSGRGPNSESRRAKLKVGTGIVAQVRGSSATPPGGKLLVSHGGPKVSAGRYNWPDNRGQGPVPRTPVSTGAGFKTPTNLRVDSTTGANTININASGKALKAYKALRGMNISHAIAMKVVGQYYGAGAPSNKLGLRRGGAQTNLRMRNATGSRAGRGASTPRPKVP